MKILITGVAGFIGSNLAERLLRKGYKVAGIDNLAYGVRAQVPRGVKFHKADIRSRNIYPLFTGIDFVFHLAAKNTLIDCQQNPVETADINVVGTANVLEAAKRARIKKVIYAETAALYEGVKKMPLKEDIIAPKGFYALSKLANQHFAMAYYRWSGLAVTGLRYFNVYGPRQDYRRTMPPVMSAFIIKLLKGQSPIIYGSGKQLRDFIHVDDINDFHLMCLRNPKTTGRVFNLGSGKGCSVLEIYHKISKILGTRVKPVFKPPIETDSKKSIADITEAKKLGWRPKTDLDKGLLDMVEYIRQEMKKNSINQQNF